MANRDVAPGLLVVGVLAAISGWREFLIGQAGVALLLGLALSPVITKRLRPGATWAAKWGLVAALALLGFRIPLSDLGSIGLHGLLLVAGTLVLVPAFAVGLGPLFGLRRPTALLVGTGIGVCGASAILATRQAAHASDEDVAVAVGAVTLAGTGALLLLPWLHLRGMFGLDAAAFGTWMGIGLPMVPQAIGAALVGGGAVAAAAATLHKLARVAALPLVVAALTAGRGTRARLAPEVWAFLLGSLYATFVGLSGPAEAMVADGSRFLFAAALAALGMLTPWRVLGRVGGPALALATTLLVGLLGALFLLLQSGLYG